MDKENIMPIPQGRSAKTLDKLIHTNQETLGKEMMIQRLQFENSLDPTILGEQDDPLDTYLQYIRWIRETYRTGNTNESELIQLLERTTHDFKDDSYYKNEIRYFKVWLEYITYSDHPGDVFNYLLKKRIGSELSIFYEKYSQFFELNDQWDEAEELLKLGISNKCRPLKRLIKSYDEFIIRKTEKNKSLKIPTKGLSNPDGNGLLSNQSQIKKKSSKMQIYQDENTTEKKSIFNNFSNDEIPILNKIKISKKENIIEPTAWQGQILANSSIKLHKDNKKIIVFSDKSIEYPITKTVQHPNGKYLETFDFNFDLFMPNGSIDEANSLIEVMLMFQKPTTILNTKRALSEPISIPNTPVNKKMRLDTENNSTQSPNIQDTPLVEYFKNSKSDFFNGETENNAPNVKNQNLEDLLMDQLFDSDIKNKENEKSEGSNNLLDAIIGGAFSDIFTDNTVTKSMDMKTPTKHKDEKAIQNNSISKKKDDDLLSSPFVENPLDRFRKENIIFTQDDIIDPYEPHLTQEICAKIENSLFDNFKIFNRDMEISSKLEVFKTIFKPNSNPIFGNKQAMIDFDSDNLFCVTKELERGNTFIIYLSEKLDGKVNAIKIESPPNIWEAYIVSKLSKSFEKCIKLESFYKYKNESFLVMPYYKQGSLSNLTTEISPTSKFFDESIAAYLTIQLLQMVIKLHSLEIIHGDISPKNIVFDIDLSSSSVSFNDIVLVGYNKAIDLSFFPPDVKFRSTTSLSQYPENVQKMPWRYEIDYYGIASIIHIFLFNEAIHPVMVETEVEITKSFSYFNQREIWMHIFKLLLNPNKVNDKGNIAKELNLLVSKLLSWFKLSVEKQTFSGKLEKLVENLECKVNRK